MQPNLEPTGQLVKSTQLLTLIMTGLRYRYASLNGVHYEAGWTDSWVHCCCYHKYPTLIDATGIYVLAVEGGSPRELTTEENEIVNRFRFSGVK